MRDDQPGTIGEAESRADVAEQNDWDPDFEAELVGSEAGRVDRMKVFGRKHVGLCVVSHPIGGGVDKLFSGKGRHRMGIEGIHVFVPGGEDGALDEVGVLSVGNVVERAINMVNEAARVVVQLVGSEHKRWNDDVFWGRRRRRRWWRRVGDVERRRRRGRPSLTDSKEEIRESFHFMVGYGGHEFHMCDTWAVITSITAPTTTVKQLAAIPFLCVCVVADRKSPETYGLKNVVYLTPSIQLSNQIFDGGKHSCLISSHLCAKYVGASSL